MQKKKKTNTNPHFQHHQLWLEQYNDKQAWPSLSFVLKIIQQCLDLLRRQAERKERFLFFFSSCLFDDFNSCLFLICYSIISVFKKLFHSCLFSFHSCLFFFNYLLSNSHDRCNICFFIQILVSFIKLFMFVVYSFMLVFFNYLKPL